jgi:hypothetical protein
MSFLDEMEKKVEALTKQKHPLCDEELRLREVYATGIALLMVRADDNLNNKEKVHLQELAETLLLTDDPAERIIATVTDAGTDIVESIIATFQKQEHKYLFILELYRAAHVDGNLQPEEQKMIDIFVVALGLKPVEAEFLELFAGGMAKSDRALMQKALLDGYSFWLELPMKVFRYFCNELEPISETTERDITKVNLAVNQGVCGAVKIIEYQEQKRVEEEIKKESVRRVAEEQKKDADLRALEEQKKEMERLVYTDLQSGLMWARNGNIEGKAMDWDDTMAWLNNLDYAGYHDWRMPTKNELMSFAKKGSYTPYEWFNSNGFNNVWDFFYWTSTPESEYIHSVWGIDMTNGYDDDINKSMRYNIWPVRTEK